MSMESGFKGGGYSSDTCAEIKALLDAARGHKLKVVLCVTSD